MRRFLLATAAASGLLSGMAATTAASAAATAAPAPAGDSQTTVGEIIVTAEKREQSLQKVPVAVTAFTSKTRDLIGLDTLQDYTNFTPGLSYSTSTDRVFLRGVGRETNTVGSDPGVATYVDGVYNAATNSAAGDELFLDRTEILRGPQGTLYGRNSIGGAINAISRRPTSHFYAEARATIGNYGVYNVEGAVSGPINDAVRFRLAASRNEQQDGYFRNVAGGPSEGGRGTSYYVEGQADAKIGSNFDIWLKAYTTENRSNPRTANYLGAYDYAEFPVGGLSPGAAFGYLTPGYVALGGATTNPADRNIRDFSSNTPQTSHLSPEYGISGQMTWSLPGFDVKYIGGYQHYDYKSRTQLFGEPAFDNTSMISYQAPLDAFNIGCYIAGCGTVAPLTVYATQYFGYEEYKTFQSHELNFNSTRSGPVQWIGGLYYYDETLNQQDHFAMPDQPQILAPANGPANPSGDVVYANGQMHATSYAVFGQADWQFTDTLKFTGGVRYSYDQKRGLERFRAICLGCSASYMPNFWGAMTPGLDISSALISYAKDRGVTAAPTLDSATGNWIRPLSANWSATTGTAGLTWTPDRDTLAYVRYSRGYKSGGFNAGGISPFPETAPEYVDAYEIGAKREFGRQLQLNGAIYYYNYTNLQIPLTMNNGQGGVAMTEFVNLKQVVSYGLELEGVWQPTRHLQFLLSYGYMSATIRNGCCFVDGADPAALQPGAHPVGPPSGGQQAQSVTGQTVPESPANKIGLNGNYTFVFQPGSLTLSASYIWKDKTYDSIFNRAAYSLAPSYSQVDLRASWNDADKRYAVILFAKNVFDSLGYDSVAGTVMTNGGVARSISLTPPRTFGVQLQYRFQ
jgi:iron complex outermembrane receptor protein